MLVISKKASYKSNFYAFRVQTHRGEREAYPDLAVLRYLSINDQRTNKHLHIEIESLRHLRGSRLPRGIRRCHPGWMGRETRERERGRGELRWA